MLVDVLVSTVLINGFNQTGDLWENDVSHPGVNHEFYSPPRLGTDDQPLKFGADSFGRDDAQPLTFLRHRRHDVILNIDSQLSSKPCGPHYPKGVIPKGLGGCHRSLQQSRCQVLKSTVRIDEGH